MSLINSGSCKEVKEKELELGDYVIIRTYSAGCWFGILHQKDGTEAILKDARRMYRWWAKKSISLSACAKYGIIHNQSKICAPVDRVWLNAIEILSMTEEAIQSISSCPIVQQEN